MDREKLLEVEDKQGYRIYQNFINEKSDTNLKKNNLVCLNIN
jgi:hypothetical protein